MHGAFLGISPTYSAYMFKKLRCTLKLETNKFLYITLPFSLIEVTGKLTNSIWFSPKTDSMDNDILQHVKYQVKFGDALDESP